MSTTRPTLRVFGAASIVPAGERPPAIHESVLTLLQRRLLECLALDAPRPVPVERLADAMWPDGSPASHRTAVQNQVSRIRARWGADVVVTSPHGYTLGIETDAALLRSRSADAEQLLATGHPLAAHDAADEVVPLWAGRPFTDIEHMDGVEAARRSLSASCKGAENTRLAAAIELGRTTWAVGEAERISAEAPDDELRHTLLARALATAGRRVDALAALARARTWLRDEYGLEPGPLLADAERQLLTAG